MEDLFKDWLPEISLSPDEIPFFSGKCHSDNDLICTEYSLEDIINAYLQMEEIK